MLPPKYRVLLVEDDAVDREMVHRLIGGSHQLMDATTLIEARSHRRDSPPDCVLLDQQLPDGKGLELLAEFVDQRIPVIMLTRHGGEAVAVTAMKRGAKDYLLKGQLRADSLQSSIRFAVESQRTAADLSGNEARLRAILETAVDCLIVVDREARIVDINMPAEVMTGHFKPDVVGRPIHEVLFLSEHRGRVRRNIEQYLNADEEGSMMRERIEMPIVRRDLSTFVAEVLLRPIRFHETVALVLVLHDVTRLREAEMELQKTRQEIQVRMVEHTAELRTAYEKLRHESDKRQQFEERAWIQQEELSRVARLNTLGEMASGLAHEINQPLTAIVAHLEASRDTLLAESNANPDVLDDLQKSIEQAHRAGEIIKRLRAMIGRRAIELMPVHLDEVVKGVVRLVDHEARSLGVRFLIGRAPGLPSVLGDRVQIEQVVLNLVRNALEELQHVPEAHRQIRIVIAMTTEDRVSVRIADEGRGVPPERLAQLFDPFHTTKPGGLGLGLSISRSIIERHGGNLLAQINADRGLTFSFTLRAV